MERPGNFWTLHVSMGLNLRVLCRFIDILLAHTGAIGCIDFKSALQIYGHSLGSHGRYTVHRVCSLPTQLCPGESRGVRLRLELLQPARPEEPFRPLVPLWHQQNMVSTYLQARLISVSRLVTTLTSPLKQPLALPTALSV